MNRMINPFCYRPRRVARILSLVLSLMLALPFTGCSVNAFAFQVPPWLPASYYQCIEAKPEDLYARYLSQSSRLINADILYSDRTYVFKNIKFVEGMRPRNYPNCIWLNQVICYAASPLEMARLHPGNYYDIVGVSKGISPEWRYSIYLADCYFLPVGMVGLPCEDAPSLPSGGY